MSEISASKIKELREKTGAGMMDCKTALTENKGDFDASVDWLRTKGLAAASKKAGRIAAEGLIAIAASDNKAAIIELNSETDFVAKNGQFQKLAADISNAALKTSGDIEELKNSECGGKKVAELITDNVSTIGENIQLRRSALLEVKEGVIASYIHNAVDSNLGKIGVLVALESAGDKAKLEALGKQLAMHIAAAKPEALNTDEVDGKAVQRERDIFSEQAKASGKPENIIEKMIEGRIRKYYEEVVLLEQAFVIDGKTKISKVMEDAAKDIGAPVKIKEYVRFGLGEGIEKKEENFAEEVAAVASSGK